MDEKNIDFTVIKEENKKKQEKGIKQYVRWIKFYIFPVVIFAFFLGTVLFFIIPQLQRLFGNIGEIDKQAKLLDSNKQVIVKLENLKQVQEQSKPFLDKFAKLIPTDSTKVVEYSNRLQAIAEASGLKVDGIKAGDVFKIAGENTEIDKLKASELPLNLIEIPTQLEISGSIENFKVFLQDIYTKSEDFFIVSEMSITKTPENNVWKAQILLVKYQFIGQLALSSDIKLLVDRSENTEVSDFFKTRFGSE